MLGSGRGEKYVGLVQSYVGLVQKNRLGTIFSQQDKNRHRGAPSFDDGISVAVHDECTYVQQFP